jgi:hypothetical protein
MIKQLAAIAIASTCIAITTVRAQDETLQLSEGSTTIVTLPSTARNVILGNPDIAEIKPFGGGTKYMLHAKKVGQTNILVFDDKDEQVYNATVLVGPIAQSPAPHARGYIYIYDDQRVIYGFTNYFCTPTGCQWAKSPPGLHEDISESYVQPQPPGTQIQSPPPSGR